MHRVNTPVPPVNSLDSSVPKYPTLERQEGRGGGREGDALTFCMPWLVLPLNRASLSGQKSTTVSTEETASRWPFFAPLFSIIELKVA